MQNQPVEDYQERGYRIRVIRTRKDFAPLHDVWDEALKNYAHSCLHMASGYLDCMWQSYSGELDGVLLIIEKDGEIVALAPLTRTKYNYRSINLKAIGPLDFMRSGRSDCAVLIDDDTLIDVLHSTTRKLGGDLWHLDRFPVESPVYNYFSATPEKSGIFEAYDYYELAVLETRIGWDDFIAAKSKNFRKNYRRILNGSEGFQKFLMTRTQQDGHNFIDDMVTIILQSWKEDAGSAITNDQRRIEFLTRLIEHYQKSGNFVGSLIYDDQKPIAFTFGVAFNDKLYAIETSYDNMYKDNSVGIASYAMVMKYAFDHPDLVVCDMDTIKTNGEYKKRWATRIDKQVSGLVLNGGMGGAVIRAGRKAASVKKKLSLMRERATRS